VTRAFGRWFLCTAGIGCYSPWMNQDVNKRKTGMLKKGEEGKEGGEE
jgi:hypothetical protein